MSDTNTANQYPLDGPSKPLALVIDDNELVRTSECLLLRHAGFEVIAAADGLEGIDIFQDHQDSVDLVVTDYCMPERNGEEVCQAVNKENPDTPVVLVSGDTSKVESDILRDFDAVLAKPFEAKHFLDTAVGLTIA